MYPSIKVIWLILKKRYDSLSDQEWLQPKLENKKFDVAIESMRILDDVEEVALINRDYQLLHDAYYLFYKYSAKTCVTLTFIDMFFFSRYGEEKLKKFYYRTSIQKYPSQFLINTFGNILVRVYGKKFTPVIKKISNLKISNDGVAKYLSV